MRDQDDLFAALGRSKFRSRFQLGEKETAYLRQKGIDVIRQHAQDFITKRLAPAQPQNDGRQTPMRGHPVFLAQHATATCCRSCLSKWHGIEQGQPLDADEVDYVVRVIERWLNAQQRAS
jgi:hypothetical protein